MYKLQIILLNLTAGKFGKAMVQMRILMVRNNFFKKVKQKKSLWLFNFIVIVSFQYFHNSILH